MATVRGGCQPRATAPPSPPERVGVTEAPALLDDAFTGAIRYATIKGPAQGAPAPGFFFMGMAMSASVTIRVPGSTANLGSGFD